MDKDGFFAPFGPTTVERKDPLFDLAERAAGGAASRGRTPRRRRSRRWPTCSRTTSRTWSPKADYLKLLTIYAKTHRKDGKPYIAEACDPDTGSWEGHDSYNHSEHYFHSGYSDLVITGLVGLRPGRTTTRSRSNPLAPEKWDYFALDDVAVPRPARERSCGTGTGRATAWARACTCWPAAEEARRGRRRSAGSTADLPADAVPTGGRRAGQLRGQQRRRLLTPASSASYTGPGTSSGEADRRQLLVSRLAAQPLDVRGVARTRPTGSASTSASTRTVDTVRLYFLDDEREGRPAGQDRPRIVGRQARGSRSRARTHAEGADRSAAPTWSGSRRLRPSRCGPCSPTASGRRAG